MKYQEYTDEEKKALENLTIREVTPEYYETHKMTIAPVVRNRHVLMFQCGKCSRYFEYWDGIRPRPFEEYEHRKYCRECWEKEQHLIRIPCRDCGKPISLFSYRNQFRGRCRECWLKTLPSLRAKYARYRALLEDILSEKGIALEPPFTDGLDETGRPDSSITDLGLRLLPLRDNEYALYLFRAGKGLLAFPDNGIGLRYVEAPSAKDVLEAADTHESLLAAGSDGKDLYVLTGKGELYSSNKRILKGEQPGRYYQTHDRLLGKKRTKQLRPVQMIDPESFCLSKVKEYFTEEQIGAAVAEFCSHGITAVGSRTYYDPEAKKFFQVLTDGNYYHGYDVTYPQVSRSEVVQEHLRHFFEIDKFIDLCESGTVPPLVILSRLPWTEGAYNPPANFGHGEYFE